MRGDASTATKHLAFVVTLHAQDAFAKMFLNHRFRAEAKPDTWLYQDLCGEHRLADHQEGTPAPAVARVGAWRHRAPRRRASTRAAIGTTSVAPPLEAYSMCCDSAWRYGKSVLEL